MENMLFNCGYDLNNILKIMQLCDSNFPIGSFNHSYGMETYLRRRMIDNAEDMRKWLHVFLKNTFIYNDGLAIRLCYEYINNQNYDEVYNLDKKLTASAIAIETREGSKLVAMRMIKLIKELYSYDDINEYEKKIREEVCDGHPAIVFSLLMNSLNMSVKEAIHFHIYSTTSTLIANAVRAIPLGQKDGQKLLKEVCELSSILYKKIMNMDEDLLGGNSPGIELSQINHETLEFRLFMS